ncbi:MAG: diacylglycerol kinase family lipid kinase [Bacillota bacterium]|nr:diacylglycerol kinase family lipid kinase [Bacillota bacterium]
MRIKVIVNPNSGRHIIQRNLERIIGQLLLDGTASQVDVYRTQKDGDTPADVAAIDAAGYDLLLGCGGDGTFNEIVNGMMLNGAETPLAMLPAGTVNDFAYALRLPTDADKFCAMVRAGNYRRIDVGRANDKYFVNVASFGMFTDVAHKTDPDFKSVLGRAAYYLQGMRDIPEQLFTSIGVSVKSPVKNIDCRCYLCLIANSASVGSVRRLMHSADVSDGLFDVLLVQKRPMMPPAAVKYRNLTMNDLQRNSDEEQVFIYFQTPSIDIDCKEQQRVELDLDGEFSGYLPLSVQVVPRAVKLLVPPAPPEPPTIIKLRGL